jgi:hypothetical protein
MTVKKFKLFVLWVALSSVARAQNVTLVEDFGTASATQVKQGLGFNVNPNNEWEFQIAQKLGSTYVRFDCGWSTTEKQKPDNTSGGFVLPPQCVKGLAFSKTYGQHPSVDALYGPPFHPIVTVKVVADVPVGSYAIPVAAVKGNLGSIKPIWTEILAQGKPQQITKKHSYSGSLLVGVDAAKGTVELASATTTPLAAGDLLTINELLYPPVFLNGSKDFMTDPSVVAYGRYAQFLAHAIHDAGDVGEVGLWNEPVWSGDLWDNGTLLYDHPPADIPMKLGLRVSIPLYMTTTPPVEGVVYDSAYTEKSGFGTIYSTQALPVLTSIGTIGKAQATVAVESFHPYGNAPEDHFWYPACLQKLVADPHPKARGLVFAECTPIGATAGSNFKSGILDSMFPEAHGGSRHNITETGRCRQCVAGTTEEQETRFVMRQFIGYQGLGVSPIMFYRLADPANPNSFGFIDYKTHEPLPVAIAIHGLMFDVQAIAGKVAAKDGCNSPKVTAYKGYYPLATVNFCGTRTASDQKNSLLFFTWQRSYPEKDEWVHLASPAAVSVELEIPSGMKVVSVKNTVSTAAVEYAVHGTQLRYQVTDDPIEVSLRPMER